MTINWSSSPIWLAMIIAPRSGLTRRLVTGSMPLAATLGSAYVPLLTAGLIRGGKLIDYRDPDAVIAALSTPETFLAAWAHYIAFDLLVGRWIWQDGLERDISARLPLLLTWLFGPAGLALYLARRRALRAG